METIDARRRISAQIKLFNEDNAKTLMGINGSLSMMNKSDEQLIADRDEFYPESDKDTQAVRMREYYNGYIGVNKETSVHLYDSMKQAKEMVSTLYEILVGKSNRILYVDDLDDELEKNRKFWEAVQGTVKEMNEPKGK
jgi:hypothetical protein